MWNFWTTCYVILLITDYRGKKHQISVPENLKLLAKQNFWAFKEVCFKAPIVITVLGRAKPKTADSSSSHCIVKKIANRATVSVSSPPSLSHSEASHPEAAQADAAPDETYMQVLLRSALLTLVHRLINHRMRQQIQTVMRKIMLWVLITYG